jgi:hypothetical protein
MDWSSLSHLAQAAIVAVLAVAFCLGIVAGQMR